MNFETTWHAEGLRWIASLFLEAANSLERAAARPCESTHATLVPAAEPVEDMRARILSRYF